MSGLVVAYFTQDSPYAKDARLFRASLNRAGVRHRIVAVHDRGSWDANTAHKARFLQAQRDLHHGPLLYVDVDAFVHSDPWPELESLAPDTDFGAHFYAGPSKGAVRTDVCACLEGMSCSRPHRLLSGTLYLGDTDGCRELLNRWVRFNAREAKQGRTRGGGQKNLWKTWRSMRNDLTTARLPGRLCYAFDRPWAYPEGEPCIIEHTIASRENRPASHMPDRAFWRRASPPRQRRVEELRELVG